MERKSRKMSRMNALWILGIALVGTFSVLIIFDVDVQEDIADPVQETFIPSEPEDQVLEIETQVTPWFLPFYDSITDGIASETTTNIWIFNEAGDYLSGGTYIAMHEVIVDQEPDLEDHFGIDLDLSNGSKKVVYSHDPFTTTDKYNFLVNIDGTWYLTQRGILVYSTFSLERILANLIYQSNNGITEHPIYA